MKHIVRLINSGLVGIGIGMTWLEIDILQNQFFKNGLETTISVKYFLFWLGSSFLIGIFFYFASLVFEHDNWSLKKQIFINFFICLSAWLSFCFFLNKVNYSGSALLKASVDFIIMYDLAYGIYFYHLWHEVKRINKKLKEI